MTKSLLIALDYDETYTADPELWLGFIRSAKARGHRVWIVTMRDSFEGGEVRSLLGREVDQVVCTARRGKKLFLERTFDEHPDIWIDDSPHFILNDARSAEPTYAGGMDEVGGW
jgi:hypothetical protein